MLGDKKRFYILAQLISGNRTCIYASNFGHQNTWKTLSCSGYKNTQLGSLGWDKVMFKVLYFTNSNISFTLPPWLKYTMIKFLRVRKLNEFRITGVYSRKAMHRKTSTRQFLIWWKSCICYCLYILTPIKKVHAFQKAMPVLIAFVPMHYEEMLKKDFNLKYFLEVKVVVIRTRLIICCRVYFLSLL